MTRTYLSMEEALDAEINATTREEVLAAQAAQEAIASQATPKVGRPEPDVLGGTPAGSPEDAQWQRTLTDRIRNPSPAGLLGVLLISFVPLAWPLFFYMGLRYFTGHRAPGSDGFAQSWIGVRMRYPSVLGLIVGWVIAVCTVVGYPFALYMTWRFATGYRDASPGTGPRASAATRPAETPLSSGSTRERLAELSDMRAAGLISDEEWATLRSAALGLPPPGQT